MKDEQEITTSKRKPDFGHKNKEEFSNNYNKPRKPYSQNRRTSSNRFHKNYNKSEEIGDYANAKQKFKEIDEVEAKFKENVEINEKIHDLRFKNYNKIVKNSGSIKITPLGGLGEIGGNMMVLETDNEAVLVDIGISFPDDDQIGVDILIPDFTYLHSIKHKLKACLITHGHEDHVGAVVYFLKEFKIPIYGTSFPLALISDRLKEHRLLECKRLFRFIEKRKSIKISDDFEVEWIHVTHSIIDCSSLAIKTPIGTILHTGDFKIDHTPVDGFATDLQRLAHYGAEGVLCLLSDSTNSYVKDVVPSEISVKPALRKVYLETKGRMILSTFSSNLHRLQQAIELAIKFGRKVCVIGRSMERNINIAMEYNYLKFPKGTFIEASEVSSYENVLILTTGSQGEENSALSRMSKGDHRHIKLMPTDTIILSARAIPGNEGSISKMLNNIIKAGARVEHEDRALHVSGHASMEEQKLMIRLIQPKFFMPIHGEYNHVQKHSKTAIACGVDPKNIYLMDAGDQVELKQNSLKRLKSVQSGKIFVDNYSKVIIDENIVTEKKRLSESGIVNIVISLDGNNHIKLIRVNSFGIVSSREYKQFEKEIKTVIVNLFKSFTPEKISNQKTMENDIKYSVRKVIYKKIKRSSLVIVTVI